MSRIKSWMKRRPAVSLLILALLFEITICQFSFWGTAAAKGTDVSAQTQALYGYITIEDMETASGSDAAVYADEEGFVHVPSGAMLLRLKGINDSVDRLYLNVDLLEGQFVKASVFAQDEGDTYTYQLGEGRVLLKSAPQNALMKIYPYGKVKNLYVRLEVCDSAGNTLRNGETTGGSGQDRDENAAAEGPNLVCRVKGVELNGRIPFSFKPVRLFVIWGVLLLCYALREGGRLTGISFESEKTAGQRKRKAAAAAYALLLVLGAAVFVGINPQCRQNLALHHAQYQELAAALSRGEVSVGEADPALLLVENPYDTINLQAKGIPYQADYAYYEGKYYVYFGIVPELLLYLPCYLLTGKALPNYLAVFVFFAGFIAASAGLVWELMKRYFGRSPFYLYFVGVFMLTGSYSLFYLLTRPDLYHVPIAASCMFTTAGLWCYLRGLNGQEGWRRIAFYALGSLCMAANAGCRPQFLLFAVLAVPLFWEELIKKKVLLSKKGAGQALALALPYVFVAAGIMYYNVLRFGSPVDFGAAYSMTSNDMTHRGFNWERILYGLWYFLFQPPHLEGNFPYLRSASIETDYLGRMVTESCFGGIFACSMLTWPVIALFARKKEKTEKTVGALALCALAAAVVICMADATGAGILLRYSADISYGIFLAAVAGLFLTEKWADQKGVGGVFLSGIRAALLLHLAFLFLILVHTDSSVNLRAGNPDLYYAIASLLYW